MDKQQLDIFGHEPTPPDTTGQDANACPPGWAEISADEAWAIVLLRLRIFLMTARGKDQQEINEMIAEKTEDDLVKLFERKHPDDRKGLNTYKNLLTKQTEARRRADRGKKHDRQ